MQEINFTDIKINVSDKTPQVIDVSHHAISAGEVIIAAACFAFLAYWYIRVSKNKEYYESWTNPNGSKINLYKKIRTLFWVYVGGIMALGLIQILISPV